MESPSENAVLAELLNMLELEKIEENLFRGRSQDLGFGTVFGGQVLGQALSAAYRTVPDSRRAHSLHAYFLRMGDASRPIVYNVDCIRDGKSFTTRRVVALQKGRAIFNMSASFQKEETGFEHQVEAPAVSGPENLKTDREIASDMQDRIPEPLRRVVMCRKPIEIRPVSPLSPFAPGIRPPVRQSWMRAVARLPDDPAIHQHLLAYASDFGLLLTTLYPHGHSFWESEMQVASLDHAMWFHRDFRMDEWLLYEMRSSNASRGRGLSHGRVFDRSGSLAATVVQEGLIRYRG